MKANIQIQGINFVLRPLSQRQMIRMFRRTLKLGLVKSPLPVSYMSDGLVIELYAALTELRAKSLGLNENQIAKSGNRPLDLSQRL